MDNDRTILMSVVDAFVTEAPVLIQRFSDAIESGDRDAATRSAHTLKGNFGILSQEAERDLWQEAESLAREGKFDELRELAIEVRKKSQYVLGELKKFMESEE